MLCGPSGCGKTTLLRQLKPALSPFGEKAGAILFEGTPLSDLPPREAAAKIGFVLQSPDNQIVTDKVWHELAFGLESLGVKTPEIRLRVAEMASFFGIQTWFHKAVTELSGGQKQILALASVMLMQPSVLILDEPTAQLDPIAAGELMAAVTKINRELGVTVVLTEHRLEEALPPATCVVVMDKGRIIAEGDPRRVGLQLREKNNGMFLAMPTPMRVWMACGGTGETPLTPRDGAAWLAGQTVRDVVHTTLVDTDRKVAIDIKEVYFRYEKNGADVIKDLSFIARYGEITAILGGNGTGKTTALNIITGLNKPHRGKVTTDATAYALPQNPQSLFVAKTVGEDLSAVLSGLGLSKEEKEEKIAGIKALCRLEGLLESHPYDLSGGEQQRAALAKVLLLEPKILLLDEPTKGLDADFKRIFADILHKLAQAGTAVLLVSHDVEFCAEYTHRCALFFDGNIVMENTPRGFFSGNHFYTTTANRMARQEIPGAITARDIILALGGTGDGNIPAVGSTPAEWHNSNTDKKATSLHITPPPKKNLPKRTILALVLVLLCIPLTILAGVYLLDDRRFYFISTLIIFQTLLPFMLIFEGRRPQAREVVVIAVLVGIAVAGRSAFFMLPQFKPVLALVIIGGVAFGGEAGFLIGAMTMFVSNMFFGQGPWTPWQMFAAGVIGLLAGVLFHKGWLRRSPVPLAVFGGLVTVLIYGGIMSPASVFIWQSNPTAEMLRASLLYGLPFNLLHGGATVFFLLLVSRPMLEKLDRIKQKYGIHERV